MGNSVDMRLLQAEDFLYGLRNAGSKFSLERIRKLCSALGNPQECFAKIHIAGTNGKGSTSAMLECILRTSGLKTGMFTSPHLLYLGERIQIGRIPIPKETLLEYVDRIKSVCDEIFSDVSVSEYPSFFEFMTALAFTYFADEKVDVAVIETGLGGRLDSTNIITADCCAITSIALEHTEFLGNTIAEIAAEKAGIIKDGVPVVVGFLPSDAMAVVEKISSEKNAPLFKVQERFNVLPKTVLEGDFQRINAAIATLCAEVLNSKGGIFTNITSSQIECALMNVSWQARWQKISLSNGATLILDASHNSEGAIALESNLKQLKKSGISPIIAVGVLGADRAKPIMSVISKYARKIVLLVPNQPRALSFDELESFVDADVEVQRALVGDIFHNNTCSLVSRGETIVSTGSIYLAGEVLASLKATTADGLSDLI